MSKPSDLTNVVERFDAFEERAGVRLEAVSAIADRSVNGTWTLVVLGELHARNGLQLDPPRPGSYTYVYATAHAADGRMIGQEHASFGHEHFYGFEAFKVTFYNLISKPSKIRVYPR